jgi:hypothetical protein
MRTPTMVTEANSESMEFKRLLVAQSTEHRRPEDHGRFMIHNTEREKTERKEATFCGRKNADKNKVVELLTEVNKTPDIYFGGA